MQLLWFANQDKGKERPRTPRFILVHPSSRSTSSLFSNKQKNSLKNHQDLSNAIQLHLHKQEPTAYYKIQPPEPYRSCITNAEPYCTITNYTPYVICNPTTQLQYEWSLNSLCTISQNTQLSIIGFRLQSIVFPAVVVSCFSAIDWLAWLTNCFLFLVPGLVFSINCIRCSID